MNIIGTEIKLVITNSRFAVVRFCNHAFDFSPKCTPLSSITIMNRGTETIKKTKFAVFGIASTYKDVKNLTKKVLISGL